ncbi:hypothetical protein GEMRC1_010931 [Eukaryota sp. GEM-RC1]
MEGSRRYHTAFRRPPGVVRIFLVFFNSFYGLPVIFNKDNFYDLFYLSRYFNVVQLYNKCGSVLTEKSTAPVFLNTAIEAATKHSDCHFLCLLDFSKVIFQENNDPVVSSSSVFPYFVNNLVTSKLLEWYLRSVQVSCLEQNWSQEELQQCLSFSTEFRDSICLYKVLIQPLSKVSDYYEPLVKLSVSRLELSLTPISQEWSQWILDVCAGNPGYYDVIADVFFQLCKSCKEIPLLKLNHLSRVIINQKQSSEINQLLLKSLVKSWKNFGNEELVGDFIELFYKLDLNLVPPAWIYFIFYSELQTDSLLQSFLNDLCVKHITPRLLKKTSPSVAECTFNFSVHRSTSVNTSTTFLRSTPLDLTEVTEDYLELLLRIDRRVEAPDPDPELVSLFSALHEEDHPALTDSILYSFFNKFRKSVLKSTARIRLFNGHVVPSYRSIIVRDHRLDESSKVSLSIDIQEVLSVEEMQNYLDSNIINFWKVVIWRSLQLKSSSLITLTLSELYVKQVIPGLMLSYDELFSYLKSCARTSWCGGTDCETYLTFELSKCFSNIEVVFFCQGGNPVLLTKRNLNRTFGHYSTYSADCRLAEFIPSKKTNEFQNVNYLKFKRKEFNDSDCIDIGLVKFSPPSSKSSKSSQPSSSLFHSSDSPTIATIHSVQYILLLILA